MAEFCDYLEQISVKCIPCVENSVAACHIKLGLQKYYPEYFGLFDTIHIIRHDTRLSIETDIEVKYETKFPGRERPGEFAEESIAKANKVKEYLEPRLPAGVKIVGLHHHYYPQTVGIEDLASIHIHAHKLVEDLDEAKLVVQKLAKTIKPNEIEAAIR